MFYTHILEEYVYTLILEEYVYTLILEEDVLYSYTKRVYFILTEDRKYVNFN